MPPSIPFGRYRHLNGSIVLVTGVALSSEDKSTLVLCEHLWPYGYRKVAQPVQGWEQAFVPVSEEQYQQVLKGDRTAAMRPLPRWLAPASDTLEGSPSFGRYRHMDGGFYLVTGFALHGTDGTEMVLYQHLWPFESITWARPLEEWGSRFARVSQAEYLIAARSDRAAAQARISAARARRKERAQSA